MRACACSWREWRVERFFTASVMAICADFTSASASRRAAVSSSLRVFAASRAVVDAVTASSAAPSSSLMPSAWLRSSAGERPSRRPRLVTSERRWARLSPARLARPLARTAWVWVRDSAVRIASRSPSTVVRRVSISFSRDSVCVRRASRSAIRSVWSPPPSEAAKREAWRRTASSASSRAVASRRVAWTVAARAAAWAWRPSGPSCRLSSVRRSPRRSRFVCRPVSLRTALSLRRRCLRTPAASSMKLRRSMGSAWRIASRRPWPTMTCISLPRPESLRSSWMSRRRAGAPLTAYSLPPVRKRVREIVTSV